MNPPDASPSLPPSADPLAAIPPENLQRLKQLADAEHVQEQRNRRWAKRLAIVFGSLVVLFLAAAFVIGLPVFR